MTTRELEKLKKKLPPKYLQELCRRLSKHSISAIRAVLRGDYNNFEIVDAAIALAEEHQSCLRARSEKISQL
jgi:DNA replication protein DnaD